MNEAKATRYQRLRRRAQAAGRVSSGAALAIFAVTPAGQWTWQAAVWATRALPGVLAPGAALVLFVACICAACGLAALPARLYRIHRVDAAYGRAEPPDGLGLVTTLAVLVLAVLASAVVLAAGYLAGGFWWCLAALVLAAGVVSAGQLGPALLARGAVRPLDRPALEARIDALAKRAGVPVSSIQQWTGGEVSTSVATVTGVGASRRVIVAAEVARHWPDDEVAVIVAHELAHHVHRDVIRTMALDAVVLAFGLLAADLSLRTLASAVGFSGPADPIALPMVAWVVLAVWLAATPLRHAQSRRQERRADRWALSWTGHADAFSSAIRRASARRLADERPGAVTRWLYHRHPPVVERLELAARYHHEEPR